MLKKIGPYVSVARPDHWFKNAFMIMGVALVFFYNPAILNELGIVELLTRLLIAAAATCLVASSNYTINEILDAPSDLAHPTKKFRPIPSGLVDVRIAYVQWAFLGAIGLALGATLGACFFWSLLSLEIMGLVYNVRPIRSKEIAYLDVLSEAINNPIRLFLGWFALTAATVPPISLILSYWMLGAFLMAAKRWAELRKIGDVATASAYRNSFKTYSQDRLMISMMFYTCACALFLGIFFARYHLELLLATPFIAGFFAEYLRITFLENSPVQNPERLYREKRLMVYLTVCVVVFFGLMFVKIPVFYEWLNARPLGVPALWVIG